MIILVLFLIFLGLAWGFFVEPHFIVLERIEVESNKDLDKELKIIQLSDFHSQNFGRQEKKVIEELKEIDADFIFITGDFVDIRTKDLESCAEFWKRISEVNKARVFGVLGNHDYWHPKTEKIIELLNKNGIEILSNESIELKSNNSSFNLVGVGDPYEGRDNLKKAMEKLSGQLPTILMAHSPEIFREAKKKDIDLILTGHTHGGQIDLPLITRIILPLKHDKDYKKGQFKDNSSTLYVNRGIGTTILPARFNSLPEITVISFK